VAARERVGVQPGGGCGRGIAALFDGVEELAVGVEGEKGGVFGGSGQFGGGKLAGGDVEAGAVDAFAFGFRVGVGAEVDEEFFRGGGERGYHGEAES